MNPLSRHLPGNRHRELSLVVILRRTGVAGERSWLARVEWRRICFCLGVGAQGLSNPANGHQTGWALM
jgi:hypothetical protein